MRRLFRSAIFPLVIIVLIVFFAETVLRSHQGKSQKLVYSELLKQVQGQEGSSGQIKQITVDSGQHRYGIQIEQQHPFSALDERVF